MAATPKWTIVQHSGYGYGGEPEFYRAVETRMVPALVTHQRRVMDEGGLLFDTYAGAETYCDEANYSPDNNGLIPRVPGTFSAHLVDGLALYIPPRPEPCEVRGCIKGQGHTGQPHEGVQR